MPTNVTLHQLSDLAHIDSPNETILGTEINTELHIIKQPNGDTIITFPFGNKFDVVGGLIIIHPKS